MRRGHFAPTMLVLALGALFRFAHGETDPIAFEFTLPPDTIGEPYAAEVWGDIELPSGQTFRLPAFYDGDNHFAVRIYPAEAGVYRLRTVLITTAGTPIESAAVSITPTTISVASPHPRPFIRLDPHDPSRFVDRDGWPYFPVGANLAWATSRDVTGFYRDEFAAFAAADLNWTRIWMCHWGQLNLDWHPDDGPGSPPPGHIDPAVARRWDSIVRMAEQCGIHLQIVLQHHGQYSSAGNPNWDENPWNAANPGGFLHTPTEFFTSPRARELTKRKYRYIVARWGYSPAILAWELFNEVHWVDAWREEKNIEAVAAWHAEMAGYLRSIDAHNHLVTTSCEPASSPVDERLDFLQPHLYAANMLIAIQRYDLDPGVLLKRPIFYGEFGEDHMPVGEAVRNAATHLVPPVWASIMGTGHHPAQPWEGHRIRLTGRLPELGAVARFALQNELPQRRNLRHFAPLVLCDERTPLIVSAGQNWHRQPPPTITVPVDGRIELNLAKVPAFIVGSRSSIADGFPNQVTFRIDSPNATDVRIKVGGAGARGASMQVLLNDRPVGRYRWPRRSPESAETEVAFSIPSGPSTVMVENNGGADWFAFSAMELDLEIPVIAATGKRAHDFLMLWLWHRDGVYAPAAEHAPVATVEIESVAAGTWQVTWWDSVTGIPEPTRTLEHPGGTLLLTTPPISRRAAVALEKR